MIIKYGCVKLRAVERKDFDLLYYLINAPEIENMTVGWNFPVSSMAHERWIENFTNSMQSIKLMIELTNSKTIGMVMLENLDWKNRTAELACKIGNRIEGRVKGDILDALHGTLKYAFDELGMKCIYCLILENNILSQNLCKRAGFVQEGILRKRVYKSGEFRDVFTFSILEKEFLEAND